MDFSYSEPLIVFISLLSNVTYILFIGFGVLGSETAHIRCDQTAFLKPDLKYHHIKILDGSVIR